MMSLKVAVIGGGIAGVTTAAFLMRYGVDVTLYEKAGTLCDGASGNPAGSVQPFFGSPTDELTSYYTQAYAYARTFYDDMPPDAVSRAGSLDIRPVLSEKPQKISQISDAKRRTYANITEDFPFIHAPCGGVYVPSARTIAPIRVAEVLSTRYPFAVRYKAVLSSIDEQDQGCTLHFTNGESAFHDVVILCNGTAAASFTQDVPLLPVKGQVSVLSSAYPHIKKLSIHGGGYAITIPGTEHLLIGATFEKNKNDASATDAADAENISRAGMFLPEILKDSINTRRASVRAVLPDRRAVIGCAPGRSRVFLNTGHGSRGLMSAPYAARLVSCLIHRSYAIDNRLSAMDIDENICRIVSPLRFRERALKKTR